MRTPLFAAVLLLPACALLSKPPRPTFPLPVGWDTLEPFAFEDLLETEFDGTSRRFEQPGYVTLQETLAEMGPLSVRAALLMVHTQDSRAGRYLLRRLETRSLGPERGSDAGDVVVAAGLARMPEAVERYRAGLIRLAAGQRPHPDLEVRVECAASAMALGSDAPIPFLLQVLRIDTYAGQADRRDFEPGPTTAWARGRAALALSRRAGVPCTYQSDASIADREDEAARLARLLQPRE